MPETISSGETTQIATAMYDDDMSLTSSFPPLYGLPMDNGSDEFADWATATGTLDTAAATTGLVPFQISVNSYVGFIVKGYYAVDFVS